MSALGNLLGWPAQAWGRLAGSASSKLVPQARLSGPMPWVIAVMLFLMLLAAAAALALGSAARQINADLAGRATVQIVNADAEARQKQALAAEALLRSDRAIAGVWIGGKRRK